MPEFIPDATLELLGLVGPTPDATQQEMEVHAAEQSFPIIGSTVGGLLTVLAQLTDAKRVFEFGSGFGYSASWFARGMEADGEIVLTEIDADELDLAGEFLTAGNYAPSFQYEQGDAVTIVDDYGGPVDVVLIDHEKDRYVEGFEAVREKISSGGAVIADNMMAGPLDFEDVLAGLQGESIDDDQTRGVIDYMEHLRDEPTFDAVTLPVGSGVSLGVKRH